MRISLGSVLQAIEKNLDNTDMIQEIESDVENIKKGDLESKSQKKTSTLKPSLSSL